MYIMVGGRGELGKRRQKGEEGKKENEEGKREREKKESRKK